jgi:hypothetical protein
MTLTVALLKLTAAGAHNVQAGVKDDRDSTATGAGIRGYAPHTT